MCLEEEAMTADRCLVLTSHRRIIAMQPSLLVSEFSKGVHVALLPLTHTLSSRGSVSYRSTVSEVGMTFRLHLDVSYLAPAYRAVMHGPGTCRAGSDGEPA